MFFADLKSFPKPQFSIYQKLRKYVYDNVIFLIKIINFEV